jgi:hypothetical protein
MDDFGLMVAQYNAVLPTLSDAQYTELQVDENGRLLVQADVSVVIDFLGTNGASDSSNILIVGTEDGTAGGAAHAIRVDAGGRIIISEIVAPVTVQATDLDIRDLDFNADSVTAHQGGTWTIDSITDPVTVQATDLDVRDLAFATDKVDVSGSVIDVVVESAGDETFAGSDEAGDGLVTIPSDDFVDVASVAVGAGESLNIYGWDFDADKNVTARLVVVDGSTVVRYLKVKVNSSAMPGREEHYSESGRIEIAGLADRTVKVQIAKRQAGGGDANASASIHARKLV